MSSSTKKHMVIPDGQVQPNVPLDHWLWAGEYAAEKKPDVIINIGDFADMKSLSMYDVGKKSYEGRTYKEDIDVAKFAMNLFMKPIHKEISRLKNNKKAQWNPRLVLTLGNHENRIDRAIDADRKLEGTISVKDLGYEEWGWEVIPYLQPIVIDGINYCHFFTSGEMGRAVTSARALSIKKHMSCTMGHNPKTEIDMSQVRADGVPIIGLFSGCLTPDHRVLTSDLRYIPLGRLQVGDTVVSFDEECSQDGIRSRRYKTGTVLNVGRDIRDVYQVKLQSGKRFKVTGDHKWLTKLGSNYRWTTTDHLRKGTNIPKLLDEWETLDSYEAGWLAGMFDGEGHLSARTTTGGTVAQLGISQKEGPTLNRIKYLLASVLSETAVSSHIQNSVCQLRIQGGLTNIAKVLGALRPERLLSKFSPEMLGRINCPDSRNDIVESVVYLGKLEIVKTDIDTKTMVVEGYPHHNCFYQHNEDYLGPQGNPVHRQIWMKHEVNNGMYYIMPVSMGYLAKRYGGIENWSPRNS